jgi:hypothetical protein
VLSFPICIELDNETIFDIESLISRTPPPNTTSPTNDVERGKIT